MDVCLAAILAGMFDNLVHQDTILYIALNLFRQRALLSVVIGTLLWREHDIDSAAFACEHLSAETLLTEVDGGTINLVQQDGRDNTIDLQSKLRRLDDVQATHKGVHDY